MHDETYKRLFAYPRTVEDLLRGFVPGPRPGEIDFSTLEKVSAEYVSDELLKRHGDAVWRVRVGERSLYLLLMLEFQSRDEPRMALRILTYTGLLYEELVRNEAVGVGEPLPAVLPIVLYNGARPWQSAREMRALIEDMGPDLAPYQPAQRICVVDERHLVKDDLPSRNVMSSIVQLEQHRSVADLAYVRGSLPALPHDPELRRLLVEWVRQLAEQHDPPEADALLATLEESKMNLVERTAKRSRRWRRLVVKMATDQGIEQGVDQGLAQQRALLQRQAALRFGPEVAARTAAVLERTSDPERLAEAGEWVVRAESGDDLVARLTQLAGNHGGS